MRVRRLDKNHDWSFGLGRFNYAQDSESIAQRVKTRLLSFKGDWVHDLEHGIPWLPHFERSFDLSRLEREIKLQILETEGVKSLDEFTMRLDPDSRQMTVSVYLTDQYDQQLIVKT
ncbi:hypothetical protein [Pragia fontium]|uniref:Uncharacterized protein n=2 Tax=Pragia fontium TaxID=82985 RepID=A0AAJ5BH89_9GAMM|nr:hypothetical protein [Pragia fontium]GKX62290.1 hypothetical protein SOASR032_08590 [Pragia fontium]SFC86333.1 hypothetical protein SAMN02745723_10523 [Pragia fontium DSM 5563 = ATCC 49100]SUB83212.1 Uncharacterised protein [Pragia fontium]VEJ56107.1 Uncharacterised protein [Pragia fontium]